PEVVVGDPVEGSPDLGLLDRFEHVGSGGSRRIDVSVDQAAGREKALCYEVADRLDYVVAPIAEYRRLMLEGSAEHGLPTEWSAFLEGRFAELDD
ncbi:MAG: gamma-glutamylcyclotransferase, partial [Solirubrobacterales bacterium]